MDDEIRKLLSLGRESFDKREFFEAERTLARVLEKHDALADVHNMMGLMAHHRGDFSKAEGHFERALALNASYTDAALNLAVTYTDLGKYEEAQAALQKLGTRGKRLGEAKELEPFARGKLANMHAEVAQAYADLGLVRDAVLELQRAVQLAPAFADLRHRLAQHLQVLGRLDEAKSELESALQHNPGFVSAKLQLGLVLVSQGNVAAGRTVWREVLQDDAENPIAKMYLRAHGVTEPPPKP